MKYLLLIFYILSPIFSIACVKTVVSNGNWSSSSIWSPVGVPINGDDVIIPPGKTLLIDPSLTTSSIRNVTNNGIILLGNNTSTLDILNNLYNNNLIINPGKIYVHQSLYNNDSLTGTGAICVWDTSSNTGTIYGTIDICDNTPPGSPPYIDINTGTVSGTVTYCMAGLCMPASLNAYFLENKFQIYPNPVQHAFHITTNFKISKPIEGEILNTMGKNVKYFSGDEMQSISVDELPSGVYFVRIRDDETSVVIKLVID